MPATRPAVQEPLCQADIRLSLSSPLFLPTRRYPSLPGRKLQISKKQSTTNPAYDLESKSSSSRASRGKRVRGGMAAAAAVGEIFYQDWEGTRTGLRGLLPRQSSLGLRDDPASSSSSSSSWSSRATAVVRSGSVRSLDSRNCLAWGVGLGRLDRGESIQPGVDRDVIRQARGGERAGDVVSLVGVRGRQRQSGGPPESGSSTRAGRAGVRVGRGRRSASSSSPAEGRVGRGYRKGAGGGKVGRGPCRHTRRL
ncbi:hypothetical protein GGS23DRAFT_196327 [Durotheca rogersii]|uniref:uncharacterized protein n=1 Tax=Durotheca rogersii TaxID=419775 RepID=UPI00221F2DBE|nr:uncharacterized protein GGS23DRAFT_196327 [Durotheca rogersii]KAI5867792.1 hypothetical protein GGS23DRAFT_196327 [Durotheca rogersii]